VVVV
jgi:hypothetical protein